MRLVPVLLLLAACGPSVPAQPTWADVEPILRGNCTQCHGASAADFGRAGDRVYRFDFFEMNEATCGAAAAALDLPPMAHGFAPLIAAAVTSPDGGGRARMPPLPAPALADWERETLVRWAQAPVLGTPPRDDRRPQLRLVGTPPASFDARLALDVLVDDPDGESVVGVINVGDHVFKLDGPGSLRVEADTTTWPPGSYPASATVCDGWGAATYPLPDVQIVH